MALAAVLSTIMAGEPPTPSVNARGVLAFTDSLSAQLNFSDQPSAAVAVSDALTDVTSISDVGT